VHKIIGFVPALLQLVMSEPIDMPVRQAGKLLVNVLSYQVLAASYIRVHQVIAQLSY